MNRQSDIRRPQLVALSWAIVSCVASFAAALARAEDSPASAGGLSQDQAWVQDRVARWQPSAQESAFHQVGWLESLVEARRLAAAEGRGVFLFTYDGASLAGYRC